MRASRLLALGMVPCEDKPAPADGSTAEHAPAWTAMLQSGMRGDIDICSPMSSSSSCTDLPGGSADANGRICSCLGNHRGGVYLQSWVSGRPRYSPLHCRACQTTPCPGENLSQICLHRPMVALQVTVRCKPGYAADAVIGWHLPRNRRLTFGCGANAQWPRPQPTVPRAESVCASVDLSQ